MPPRVCRSTRAVTRMPARTCARRPRRTVWTRAWQQGMCIWTRAWQQGMCMWHARHHWRPPRWPPRCPHASFLLLSGRARRPTEWPPPAGWCQSEQQVDLSAARPGLCAGTAPRSASYRLVITLPTGQPTAFGDSARRRRGRTAAVVVQRRAMAPVGKCRRRRHPRHRLRWRVIVRQSGASP